MSQRSGPRCEIVGIVSRRLMVRLSLCTRVLRRTCTLHSIAMRHVHYMVTVMMARAHAPWRFLVHMLKCAQAISVHGQTVCLTNTLCSIFRHVSIHSRLWSGLLLVQTGGWAPSTKQQTKTSYGASGPLAATSLILIMKIGVVAGITANPEARPKTMRRKSGL